MGRVRRAAALAAVVAVGAACGTGEGQADRAGDAPLVLATTSIWADVTANVACGGLATVEPVIPVGADSHSFEPSLADRGRMRDAAVVVVNGLGLEEGLADTLASARHDGARLFTVAEEVQIPPPGSDHGERPDQPVAAEHASDGQDGDADADADDHEQDHAHQVDPHVWFDPLVVDAVLDPLAEVLVAEAGLDAGAVGGCVAAYRDRLGQAHQEVLATVAELPPEERLLVTSHGSFDHFARRYGFEVIGTVLPSTSSMAEANPAALEQLARTIEATGVSAVFSDVGLSARDAEALARRVGDVAVVDLYTESLGEPGSEAGTYLDLLRTDARLIVDGLRGGGR